MPYTTEPSVESPATDAVYHHDDRRRIFLRLDHYS